MSHSVVDWWWTLHTDRQARAWDGSEDGLATLYIMGMPAGARQGIHRRRHGGMAGRKMKGHVHDSRVAIKALTVGSMLHPSSWCLDTETSVEVW